MFEYGDAEEFDEVGGAAAGWVDILGVGGHLVAEVAGVLFLVQIDIPYEQPQDLVVVYAVITESPVQVTAYVFQKQQAGVVGDLVGRNKHRRPLKPTTTLSLLNQLPRLNFSDFSRFVIDYLTKRRPLLLLPGLLLFQRILVTPRAITP